MRADAREGGGLCLRPSPTAIGPAAYGHRLQTRQDFSGLVGRVLRCRRLRRRGAGGCGHGGRRHPADPLRTKPALTGAALRKAILAIWCVAFCGMQWRAIGQLCDIPFSTLYTLFARWTRLAVAPAAQPLDPGWRRACGDTPNPAPSSSTADRSVSAELLGRVFHGGKKIKGIKIHLRSISTASHWRSTSRRQTGMTARASSRCRIGLPAASKGQPWAISVIGVSG